MYNVETLRSVLKDEYAKLSTEELIEHFRSREQPNYLFSYQDAKLLKDDEILKEAEEVMNHYIFGWQFDGPIDWHFNPTTETSRDNEWSWSLFRTIYWQPLARAYALTGDERYTREFLSQMHSFIDEWPAEEFIKDVTFVPKQPFPGTAWRTIETGIRMYTTWLPVFEIFRKSSLWTGDDIADYLLTIRNHALFLMTHYSNHNRSSNWLSMEVSALYQIAVMFPEFKEADVWFDEAYQRLGQEVRYCFSQNGVHMEKTPIYHMVASIAFAQALKISDLNGIDLPPYAWEVIRRSARYIYSLIKPDHSTPMIGDADRITLTDRKADTSVFEGMNLTFFPKDLNELRAYFTWMYEILGDEEFKYFATIGKEGKEPEKTDYEYGEEGIWCMRTGWEEDADYLLTHCSQLERGERSTHSHEDANHAEVTLLGEDILVDCGRYIYRSSIWKDWRSYFVSALSHNTLYCDDHELGSVPEVERVRGVRALCHFFGEMDGAKVMDVSHNGYAYMPDPIYHRRKFVLLPGHRVVLVDYVTGRGREDHDLRLMYNFNTPDATLDGNTIHYRSKGGKEFDVELYCSAKTENTLLCGSEDPKGGWISYGYPVRVPTAQVTERILSRAPFVATTTIAQKGDEVKTRVEGNTVYVETSDSKWKITEEKVERV